MQLLLTPSVYYLPLPMLHLATSVARPNLISLGTCMGKFSKSGKFKLGVTSLDWLAKYAKYKVGNGASDGMWRRWRVCSSEGENEGIAGDCVEGRQSWKGMG